MTLLRSVLVVVLLALAWWHLMQAGDSVEAVVLILILVLIIGGGAVWWWGVGGNGTKANTLNQEGVRLLGRGHVASALEQFHAATALLDLPVFRLHAAVAEIQLFRFDRALDGLATLASQPEPLSSMVREQRTIVSVLMGTGGRAELDAFRDKDAALTRLLLACIELRAGQFDAAEAILSEPVQKQLGGWLRALSETLAAWCAWALRGERRPIDRSTLFGEADPEGLLGHWPELAAFLDQAP